MIINAKIIFGLFLIIAFLNVNVVSMAQSNIEVLNKIQRKRLSKKEVNEMILAKKGKLNETLSNDRFNPTYILEDNQILVFFDTHGYLYNSYNDLKEWLSGLRQRKGPNSSILKDRLLHPPDFGNHTAELINSVGSILKIKILSPSLEQLKEIDNIIKNNNSNISFNSIFFSGMIAYVGEIFKKELPNARRVSVNLETDNTIWEPYVYSSNKKYNPFFLVYRELFEELPETNRISIYDRVIMELATNK